MSELQFPKDPTVGQEYDFAPYKYYWDGAKWKTKGVGYNPVNDLQDELEPRISNNEAKVFEALRRSYAAAGLNLVERSFEEGGVLTSITDVMITASGAGYSWGGPEFPHNVSKGTAPALTPGFVRRYAPTNAETESAKEALRRSYADVGLTVKGYTKDGATLTSTSDVVIHNTTGKGYSRAGVYPEGGYIVAPGTDPLVDPLYIDKSDVVGGIVADVGTLSYYGTDRHALVSLLTYAKTTGQKIRLDADVIVESEILIDFEGVKLCFDFGGYSVYSDDILALHFLRLGAGSEIITPSLKNITPPWAVTLWDARDEWLTSAEIAATLKQTNDIGYIMPTSNFSNLWPTLTAEQRNQTITAGMFISSSTRVTLYNPRGRYCAYQFYTCSLCTVINPQIESGGKGTFGTIVFNNTNSVEYGIGNEVIGGYVHYGSFSGVAFLRNKRGGVSGGFTPKWCGESGVKTCQGEVSGRSARCYDMRFGEIYPNRTLFDGVDFTSDYGPVTERVDDFPLEQYGWNRLPTRHTVWDIKSYKCARTGVVADGSYNDYSDLNVKNCKEAGVLFSGYDSIINNPVAAECNTSNRAGTNQISVPNTGNVIINPSTITSANITAGYSVYAPQSTVFDHNAVGNITSVLAKGYGGKKASSIRIGGDDTTTNAVAIDLHPRGNYMSNGVGEVGAVLQSGVSGSEQGYARLRGVAAGNKVHGVKALGDAGGIGSLAVGSTANSGWVDNSEMFFYQSGTSLKLFWKLDDGTYKTAVIIA